MTVLASCSRQDARYLTFITACLASRALKLLRCTMGFELFEPVFLLQRPPRAMAMITQPFHVGCLQPSNPTCRI